MKKIHILLLLFAFISKRAILIAQSNFTKDTSYVLNLLNRGEKIYGSNIDSSVIYWNKGLQKVNLMAKKFPSKLDLVLKMKATLLNNIGYSEMIFGRQKAALNYFDSCSKLQVQLALWPQYATTVNNLAYIYSNSGQIEKAIKLYEQSIKIYTENKYFGELPDLYNNIGLAYSSKGDYVKAIEYYFTAEKYSDKYLGKNKPNDKTEIYLNIANLFMNLNDTTNFIKYSKASVNEGLKYSKFSALGYGYLNLGKIYLQSNRPLAKYYYLKSLDYRKKAKDEFGIANSLYNIASLSRSDSSKALYEEARKRFERVGNLEGVAYCDLALEYYLIKSKKIKEAEDLLQRTLQQFIKIKSIDGTKLANEKLFHFYKERNSPALALKHYERVIALKDSINNVELHKKTLQKDIGYDFEKKEIKLKAEHLLKEQLLLKEKKNQRNIIYSIVVIFSLLLLFSIIIFKNLQDKRKINKVILAQKTLVDEKQKEILDSIRYAKRIQRALLPSEKYVDRTLKKLNGNDEV